MWKMIVKNTKTGRTWDEPINILSKNYTSKPLPIKTPFAQAKEVANNTVVYFNSTLGEEESARELVEVFFESNDGLRYP